MTNYVIIYKKITDKHCCIVFTLQRLADLHDLFFRWDKDDLISPQMNTYRDI